jgi:hypothetical protein
VLFRIPQTCQGYDPDHEDIRGETIATKAKACHQEIVRGAVSAEKIAQRVSKAQVPPLKHY